MHWCKNNHEEPVTFHIDISCDRLSGEHIYTWGWDFTVDPGVGHSELFCRLYQGIISFGANPIYKITITVDCEYKSVSGNAIGIFSWVILQD